MDAPVTFPSESKLIFTSFPKREELLFLIVLALPKLSKIGFVASIPSESSLKVTEEIR
jgi:hypothetical protein